MPNRLPLPQTRFNVFASAALVVILLTVAVSLNTIATSTSGDTSSKPPTPATVIRIVTVVNVVVVTAVPTIRATNTRGPTAPPYRSPLPTRTATPPWLWDDQTGNQLDTREGTVSP